MNNEPFNVSTNFGIDPLYDVLQELRNEPGGDVIDAVPPAVWLKALLVHSADWGPAFHSMVDALRTRENSRKFREYLTRLLGYGAVDVARVAECTQQRVTALGGGSLRADESHIHSFPLPPSLGGQLCWRRLVLTLAWLTPVNPEHQAWRRADLYLSLSGTDRLQVDRAQADGRAVGRGTVQHEILEGERASAFADGDSVKIQVNCCKDAGALEDLVPYAFAITLQVREGVTVELYEEVRARVHAARIAVSQPG